MKKLLLFAFIAVVFSFISKNNDDVMIPSSSIRMRVIAASDSKEDQENKIIVKSALEEFLYNLTDTAEDYNQIDKIINDNEKNINDNIEKVMINNNLTPEFNINYGYNYFPEKKFKGVTYNSGMYKSVVVTLGEGEGENWWCVLYPPLCLVDEKVDEYEYRSLIKDTLLKYN